MTGLEEKTSRKVQFLFQCQAKPFQSTPAHLAIYEKEGRACEDEDSQDYFANRPIPHNYRRSCDSAHSEPCIDITYKDSIDPATAILPSPTSFHSNSRSQLRLTGLGDVSIQPVRISVHRNRFGITSLQSNSHPLSCRRRRWKQLLNVPSRVLLPTGNTAVLCMVLQQLVPMVSSRGLVPDPVSRCQTNRLQLGAEVREAVSLGAVDQLRLRQLDTQLLLLTQVSVRLREAMQRNRCPAAKSRQLVSRPVSRR